MNWPSSIAYCFKWPDWREIEGYNLEIRRKGEKKDLEEEEECLMDR